jgi:hypothetical protein
LSNGSPAQSTFITRRSSRVRWVEVVKDSPSVPCGTLSCYRRKIAARDRGKSHELDGRYKPWNFPGGDARFMVVHIEIGWSLYRNRMRNWARCRRAWCLDCWVLPWRTAFLTSDSSRQWVHISLIMVLSHLVPLLRWVGEVLVR